MKGPTRLAQAKCRFQITSQEHMILKITPWDVTVALCVTMSASHVQACIR